MFSSRVVTPDMRVRAEPRARTPRARLDELLAAHGLVAVDGPGAVIQVVRAKPDPVGARRPPRPVRPTGTIDGRVLEMASGAPLDGVLVWLVGARQATRTDTMGRFEVTDVRSGVHTLLVSRPGYVLTTRRLTVTAGETVAPTVELARRGVSHRERLTVKPPPTGRVVPGGREIRLGRRELTERGAVLTHDPLRAVHALPRVAATDDFRTDFSVRGSPYRHLGVVVDGVATPWLRHMARGRGDTDSLGMIGGDLLDTATLETGAYPQRDGDVLGAQVSLAIREGSRDDTLVRGALSGTHAAVIAEGPLGASGRGSWLVSARRSNLDWPRRPRGEHGGTVFGFADGLAKLVYDVGQTHQATITVLGGRSTIEGLDDGLPVEVGDGANRTQVVNLAWRSTLGANTVLSQRAYAVGHRFLNYGPVGPGEDRGAHGQVAYRADLLRTVAGGVFEGGALVERSDTVLSSPSADAASSVGHRSAISAWRGSGYAHVTWTGIPRLILAPGMRLTRATGVPQPAVSPWVLAEWSMAPGWTMTAGARVAHQFPWLELPVVASPRPERATHLDVGVERRFEGAMRWQATVFWREERDLLLDRGRYPRLVDTVLVDSFDPRGPTNTLSGSARGVELLVERRAATGLSGWVAYSFGKTRYTDARDGATFWGDFDQRHAVTLSGTYTITDRTSVAADLRGGSNFPLPGYLIARAGHLFVSDRRNETRLPAYVRLDLRVSRTLTLAGRRVSLFAEVLNVLNRTNLGAADGVVRPGTGEAVGYTRALLPRLPSAGLVIELVPRRGCAPHPPRCLVGPRRPQTGLRPAPPAVACGAPPPHAGTAGRALSRGWPAGRRAPKTAYRGRGSHMMTGVPLTPLIGTGG